MVMSRAGITCIRPYCGPRSRRGVVMVGRFGNGCLPFVGDRERDLGEKRNEAQERAEPS